MTNRGASSSSGMTSGPRAEMVNNRDVAGRSPSTRASGGRPWSDEAQADEVLMALLTAPDLEARLAAAPLVVLAWAAARPGEIGRGVKRRETRERGDTTLARSASVGARHRGAIAAAELEYQIGGARPGGRDRRERPTYFRLSGAS